MSTPTSPVPGRVLVTGGAGFVGSSVCLALAAQDVEVVAFDSLRRRGSELNLARLRQAGVAFVHGDVREPGDLRGLPALAAIVECSAEPSVLAGMGAGAEFAVHTNLVGAFNCLELARRDQAHLVFVSTSRIYPIAGLSRLALREEATRFVLEDEQPVAGASSRGVAEDFPLAGSRTLYGATKLAAELLIGEYGDAGVRTTIDRCGVIAGPWQMGKVDQGVFTHWLLAHHLGRPLTYIGYGGEGKQVRDLLHVDDVCALVIEQLGAPEAWDGATVNVGGGVTGSLSLAETTEHCRRITGRAVAVEPVHEARPGDVPCYLSDCSALFARTEWRPRHRPEEILEDTYRWIRDHEAAVVAALT